jgi:Cyclin, N-terminal domain
METFIAIAVLLLWHGQVNQDGDEVFVNYVRRVTHTCTKNLTLPVVMTALLFIDRLSKLSTAGRSKLSEYRVLIACLILADNALNDEPYAISHWAEVSGMPAFRIIAMRRELLELLSYDINVSSVAYNDWIHELNSMPKLQDLNIPI